MSFFSRDRDILEAALEYAINTGYFNVSLPLKELPSLPHIKSIQYGGENLESLTVLSKELKYLIIPDNKKLKSLPELPDSLIKLIISGTGITNINSLPVNLRILNLSSTAISHLPPFPESLKHFNCSKTNITQLPNLPSSLIELNCHGTQITELPSLPQSLCLLICHRCQLTVLPKIPVGVIVSCEFNPWKSDFQSIVKPPFENYDYSEDMTFPNNLTHEQIDAVNQYHVIKEIKEKGRIITGLLQTLGRSDKIGDDALAVICSFLTGIRKRSVRGQMDELKDFPFQRF